MVKCTLDKVLTVFMTYILHKQLNSQDYKFIILSQVYKVSGTSHRFLHANILACFFLSLSFGTQPFWQALS